MNLWRGAQEDAANHLISSNFACVCGVFVLFQPFDSRHVMQWPGSRCTGLGRVLRIQSTKEDPECRPPGYQRCLDEARGMLLTFYKPWAQIIANIFKRHPEPISLQFADSQCIKWREGAAGRSTFGSPKRPRMRSKVMQDGKLVRG